MNFVFLLSFQFSLYFEFFYFSNFWTKCVSGLEFILNLNYSFKLFIQVEFFKTTTYCEPFLRNKPYFFLFFFFSEFYIFSFTKLKKRKSKYKYNNVPFFYFFKNSWYFNFEIKWFFLISKREDILRHHQMKYL